MKKSIVRNTVCGLLAASLVSTPIASAAQDAAGSGSDKSLGTMIEEREQRVQSEAAKKKKRGIGGFIADALPFLAGAATTYVCGGFGGTASNLRQAGCIAAGGVVGYGALELKKSIRKRINEKEQAELLAAAGDSLSDGQPRTLTFPDSNASASVAASEETFFQDVRMEMFYDSVTLASRERVEVIAQPYLTTTSANLRKSPNTDEAPVRTLSENTPLHVVGQVPGEDWYMVSQRVSEGEDEALMVVGYMSSDLLAPAPDDLELPAAPAPATVQLAEFDVALRCSEVSYQLRDAKGKLIKDKSKDCIGPEGQLVSA